MVANCQFDTKDIPYSELFGLAGKTVIVTASGKGMGRGIAERLGDAGANVVVSHRRLDEAELVAAGIRSRGGKAIAAVTDVTDFDQMDRTVAAALAEFGTLDVLVNNAGGMPPATPFTEVTPDFWQDTIDRNLKGAYFFAQKAAKTMIDAGRPGKIINIASTAARRPDFQSSAYNIAKVGIVILAQSLCTELASYNILVNTIIPGPIRTANTAAAYDDPDIGAAVGERLPLKKPGNPDDIGNAVLFCASGASNYMTGATLTIDGGWLWG